MSKTTRRDLLKSGALAGLAGIVGSVPGVAAPTAPSYAKPRWQAPAKQTGKRFKPDRPGV